MLSNQSKLNCITRLTPSPSHVEESLNKVNFSFPKNIAATFTRRYYVRRDLNRGIMKYLVQCNSRESQGIVSILSPI